MVEHWLRIEEHHTNIKTAKLFYRNSQRYYPELYENLKIQIRNRSLTRKFISKKITRYTVDTYIDTDSLIFSAQSPL